MCQLYFYVLIDEYSVLFIDSNTEVLGNEGEVLETNDNDKETKERPTSKLDKKTQKLIADLKRCRIQMENTRKSIQKPTV